MLVALMATHEKSLCFGQTYLWRFLQSTKLPIGALYLAFLGLNFKLNPTWLRELNFFK